MIETTADIVNVRSNAAATRAEPGSLAMETINGVMNVVNDQGVSLSPGALLSKVHAGVAAAGPVTLTGAVVGQRVRQVLTVTAGALVDSTALFETVITVTDQIQQISAVDKSAVVFNFLLQS